MVRDFTYNEKDIADGKMEISKLEDDKKKQYVSSTANGNYMLIDGFLYGLLSFISLMYFRALWLNG